MIITTQELIERYQLQSHPEGGHYLETYRSDEKVEKESLPGRFKGDRNFSTAIYFLLEGNEFSAFHRIQSDELWHFYAGGGLHIYLLHPDGKGEVLKLGNDMVNGYSFQQMVPAGCWFASKPVSEIGFCFVGCTVSPGFDFSDFELAERDTLIKEYPAYSDWINMLIR